jgi:battenin
VFSVVVFAAAYYATFYHGLFKAEHEDRFDRLLQAGDREKVLAQKKTTPVHMLESSFPRNRRMREDDESTSEAVEMVVHFQESTSLQSTESAAIYNLPAQLTPVQRFRLVLSLWPYTIPLFIVYAAEYMMQAGVWSAIGFPVESQTARAQFYHYSNWMYQVGVFVSRSSGNLFSASLPILWLMPALQVINLVFFCMTSIHHFVYSWWLLLPAFCAGLLGGGVYVQGFSRINMDMPLELREFAISSAGVADSLGILTADISALFIQSCIYDKNNIQGAVVSCPVG